MLGVLGVAAAPVAAGQANNVIAGRIVDAATGKPVSAAIVSVAGNAQPRVGRGGTQAPPRILTGADGRFVFRDLASGSFTVTAAKTGYAEGASGRRRAGGSTQPVDATSATAAADVVIRMWKYGAVSGTVTDEAGEPVVGLFVRLLPRARPGAAPDAPPAAGSSFVPSRPGGAIGVQTLTDDRGVYRFGNVPNGDYLVMASPPLVSSTRNLFIDVAQTGRVNADSIELLSPNLPLPTGRTLLESSVPLQIGDAIVSVGRGRPVVLPSAAGHIRVYPPTFHPAALAASQAATITVSGEERGGIDIAIAPAPAARVAGTMFDRDGPSSMTTLRLVPVGSEAISPDVVAAKSVTDGTGNFVFAGVPAGQYRLRGTVRTLGAVDVPVTVGGDDIDALTVTATPLPRITATLQFDGNTPPPANPSGRGQLSMPGFVLDPASAGSGPDQLGVETVATVPGDRAYTLTGYPPGRYRVRVVNSPAGWMFKAAMLNGVDVSETPFDLTKDVPDLTLVFTDRWTGISGSVQGQGADAATVVIFPADASKWSGERLAPRRFKSARADARGQFGVSSLPAGDYYAIAIPEEQSGEWRDPAVLDGLARLATAVTILDGEHRTVSVPLKQVRQ